MQKKAFSLLVATFLLVLEGTALANNKAEEVALRKAARTGDQEKVAALIEKKVNINAVDENGWTALHHASHHEKLRVAYLLVANGALVDGPDEHAKTPLSLALENKNSEDLVDFLLLAGANPNHLSLHSIVQRQRVDLLMLVMNNVNIHIRDAQGRTLLHIAADVENGYIAGALIDSKINLLARDTKGKTAFDYAYARRNGFIMKLILMADFPLKSVQATDPVLYEAIERYGIKIIDGWFNAAKNQPKNDQFSAQQSNIEKAASWIDTIVAGILISAVALYHFIEPTPRVPPPAVPRNAGTPPTTREVPDNSDTPQLSTRDLQRLIPPRVVPGVQAESTSQVETEQIHQIPDTAREILLGLLTQLHLQSFFNTNRNELTVNSIAATAAFTLARDRQNIPRDYLFELFAQSVNDIAKVFKRQLAHMKNMAGHMELTDAQSRSLENQLWQTYLVILQERLIKSYAQYTFNNQATKLKEDEYTA